MDRESSGRIRLSADPTTARYVLAPVLALLTMRYPKNHIEPRPAYTLDSIARNETEAAEIEEAVDPAHEVVLWDMRLEIDFSRQPRMRLFSSKHLVPSRSRKRRIFQHQLPKPGP